MIFAKIYMDDDGCLVMDSVAHSVSNDIGSVSLSELRSDFSGRPYRVPRTTVIPTSAILCSTEAAAFLGKLFDPQNPSLSVSRFDGDFEFYHAYDEDFAFAYRPDSPDVTYRRVAITDRIAVCISHGVDHNALEKLTLADNETVKQLALREPIKKSDIPKVEG